ncbi:MAG: hypothetical protein R2698_02640 [Microthrixaceae bacterium]
MRTLLTTRPDTRRSARSVVTGAFFVLLAGLAFVAFAPSARVGFFADDFGYLNSTLGPRWYASKQIWDLSGQVLRPVTVIAIGVQHDLFAFRPFAFHLVALLLVVGEGGWIWLLARRLDIGEFGALTAAAVLVLHTTQGYLVMWTAATSSLYAVHFGLALVWLCAVPSLSRRRMAGATGLLLLALLSREICLVLPAIVTLVRWQLGSGRWWQRMRTALRETRILWLVLGGFVLTRVVAATWARTLPVDPNRLVPILDTSGFRRALPDSPTHLRDLLVLATSPFRFTLGPDGLAFPGWVVLSAALIWAVVCGLLVREFRAGRPLALVAMGWFLVGLVPPTLLQPEPTYVNYIDLALPGLALAVGVGFDRLLAGRSVRIRTAVGAVGLAMLTWVAFNGGNTLVKPPPAIISRPAQIIEQLRGEYPDGPPRGSTVVIDHTRGEDYLWTSKGDLARVLFDDPTLVVEFDPKID